MSALLPCGARMELKTLAEACSTQRFRPIVVFLAAIWLTGCARAPSFDLLGSFFPAWLLCLAAGLLLTFAAGWLLSRLGIVIAVPILTYPCLTALLACALWLALFK
jgi:NhaP-type Na+/H+ or K+/H+ antiporter